MAGFHSIADDVRFVLEHVCQHMAVSNLGTPSWSFLSRLRRNTFKYLP